MTKAPLTIRADDKTRTYGTPNPAFTASITGFVNGETASVLSGAPVLSTTALLNSKVGTYPIVADVSKVSANNYLISNVNGVLYVTPADQTISFDAIPAKTVGDPSFQLNATASSLLPVKYAIVSGPAIIADNKITMTGAGVVTMMASQDGDNNHYPSDDVIRNFCVNPLKPTITKSLSDPSGQTLVSSNPEGNQWYLNNSLIQSATSDIYYATQIGEYKVVSSVDGCIGEFSDNYGLTVITGIETSAEFSAYPNPAIDHLTITGLSENSKSNIYSATGSEIKLPSHYANGALVLDLRFVSAGVYLVKITDNKYTRTIKFIKN
ncbi:MAG: MBG domain-containing protein [Cyclobacteriaceae bacterium]